MTGKEYHELFGFVKHLRSAAAALRKSLEDSPNEEVKVARRITADVYDEVAADLEHKLGVMNS
jgi:hypothetical protein